jgi:hypothetical protein
MAILPESTKNLKLGGSNVLNGRNHVVLYTVLLF